MLGNGALKQLGILALATMVVNGCSSKKDNATYDMNTKSIFADGCLNLGRFYESLHNMPSDGRIRAFTYNFQPADQDANGYAVPSARIRVLTRASYFYSESALSELRSTWTSGSQDGCTSGTLYDVYGNKQPYTVDSFQGNSLTAKFPNGSTQRFELTSDRSMKISTDEYRGSQCIDDAPLKAKTEIVLRWGPPADLPSGESLSATYMRTLSKSVTAAPDALRESVANVDTDSISLATSLLMSMNSMQVNSDDLRYCSSPNSAPEMPPLPFPDATPTPTPTPDATPAPAATP